MAARGIWVCVLTTFSVMALAVASSAAAKSSPHVRAKRITVPFLLENWADSDAGLWLSGAEVGPTGSLKPNGRSTTMLLDKNGRRRRTFTPSDFGLSSK